jgi:CHASE2 domain-containing sensor protein
MSMITTNVGSADRIARIVVGLALIAFALFGPADITWKWVGWIGVVPLLTALAILSATAFAFFAP